VCPLIGKKIKLVKKLGEGEYGAVFEIHIPGQGNKQYAVKKSHSKERTTIRGCTVMKEYTVGKYPEQTTVSKGDIVCDDVYTEYLIALLAGKIARSGKSANFFDTFYFATCDDKKKQAHYTFMEMIDTSLRATLPCVSEKTYKKRQKGSMYPEVMDYILVQTLHSIGVLQSWYKIVHGDLHTGNIFLEIVTPETTFGGKKLLEVDYYEYRINGKSIYIPGGKACPFIVKIGDWGLASKFSKPQIFNKLVIKDGYTAPDGTKLIPNFYTPAYDVVYTVDVIWSLNRSNKFIADILSFIAGVPPTKLANFHRQVQPRPTWDLMTRFAHVTPASILTDEKLMGDFSVRPNVDESKIALLGEFNE
jgi:serine/threonine protein kinase